MNHQQDLIERATDAAINTACKIIQDALGVATGDVAGQFFSGAATNALQELLREYLAAEQNDIGKPLQQWCLYPWAIDPTAIDDDTGKPVRRPTFLVVGGNAYWLESLPNSRAALMTAPIHVNGARVCWDDACEVDDERPGDAEIRRVLRG